VNNIIEEAEKEGYEFIFLEPEEDFDSAIKEFLSTEGRLVYNVSELLDCLSRAHKWNSLESIEWFDYNILPLAQMRGGPVFYDVWDKEYIGLNND
tara:strand:- start:3368 stop:3652 length:285 start_codon:yes stop_codon:yes gene_type:complete